LKPKDQPNPGPLEPAYFAPEKRATEFEQAEIVYDGSSPRKYPKGTFIYRLSGRNRENSASYYTPEPLARTLVKYALKELLEGKKADDILELKVIEPAMGSAAFLVEVVNQLTDRYLELKQAELDRRIPHEERADVERRVRAYIADRNVFGVDLNPIAVDLGQISLWLNCLHRGGHAPWFDDQVHNGNSLVGARRAVFPAASLSARREDDRWYKRKPREIG
jgi:type II restriction/modification system DNA methylase subunit YeeA